jgi:hypothetical protein
MANSPATLRPEPRPPVVRQSNLALSRYDRVSGLLISLLILLGCIFLALLSVWWSHRVFTADVAVPVVMEEIGDQEEAPIGPGHDIEPPPPLETDLVDENTEQVLDTVDDALASRSTMLEPGVAGGSRYGVPGGTGHGKGGGGTGLGRQGKPRRWELRFTEGNTLETYARQLDLFGIELGILRPGNKVLYVSGLSRARPLTREGDRDAEKRYRFTWTQGSLEEADRLLLAKAGVDVGRNILFKFLPPEQYQKLAAMEKEASGGQKVRSVVFGVRSAGAGYEFYVIRWAPY